MITTFQSPLHLTPSNAEHIYSVSSSNSGNTDFQYVANVYMDVSNSASTPTLVATLKVRPNTYGVGTFDLGEIVHNYLIPNPRSETAQIYSQTNGVLNTGLTINGLITNNKWSFGQVMPSNAFNTDTDFEFLPHVREYRVMIGEEWTTGSTTYSSVPDEVVSGCSSLISYVDSSTNTVFVEDAGRFNGDDYYTGFAWEYTDGISVLSQGNTTQPYSALTFGGVPANYFLYLYEHYLNNSKTSPLSITEFRSDATGVFKLSSKTILYDWAASPCSVITWPGAAENKMDFNYNLQDNIYWNTAKNSNVEIGFNQRAQIQHQWRDAYKYKFTGSTYISSGTPSQFLTTFGDDLTSVNFTNLSFVGADMVSDRVRHRKHHYQCPVVVSWFNGNLDLYSNPVNRVVGFWQDSSGSTTSGIGKLGTVSIKSNNTGYTSVDNSICYYSWNFSALKDNGGGGSYGLVFDNTPKYFYAWASSGDTSPLGSGGLSYSANGLSEVVRFDLQFDDCLSDPVHFLFLNQRGVWDTYTFDKKNIKTYNKSTKTYAQGGIRSAPVYNRMSYQQRDVIYNTDVVESVVAQSWYMDENDRKIVEELFLSNWVYIMKGQDVSELTTMSPYLIPVTITSTSLQEYKQRYEKVYQYTLEYQYNPISQFNTNL